MSVQTNPRGWLLTSGSRTQLDIDYDVVDCTSGEIVLHDQATLACSSGGAPRASVPAPARRSRSGAPLPPAVSQLRGAAEVNGVGLPLAEFDDELPHDCTVEQPSPYVRSRVTPPGSSRASVPIVVGADGEVIATLTVRARSSSEALALLRDQARQIGADALAPPRFEPQGRYVRGTAIALRLSH